jgi:hypothetical protein
MKPYPLLWLAMVAPYPAWSQTAIMGHHVGETTQQFLAAEPVMLNKLEACRREEPKPLTPEQIHALSKQDAYALGQQVFTTYGTAASARYSLKWAPNRHQLETLVAQGMIVTLDKRMPGVVATCRAVLALTASPAISTITASSEPGTKPYPVKWSFGDGRLLQIDIDFQEGGDFDAIEADLTHKTGVKPGQNKEADTPNLYGGVIEVYRKATWLTSELFAVLEEDEKIGGGQMHLSVVTRSGYDSWAKTHAVKGPLD